MLRNVFSLGRWHVQGHTHLETAANQVLDCKYARQHPIATQTGDLCVKGSVQLKGFLPVRRFGSRELPQPFVQLMRHNLQWCEFGSGDSFAGKAGAQAFQDGSNVQKLAILLQPYFANKSARAMNAAQYSGRNQSFKCYSHRGSPYLHLLGHGLLTQFLRGPQSAVADLIDDFCRTTIRLGSQFRIFRLRHFGNHGVTLLLNALLVNYGSLQNARENPIRASHPKLRVGTFASIFEKLAASFGGDAVRVDAKHRVFDPRETQALLAYYERRCLVDIELA